MKSKRLVAGTWLGLLLAGTAHAQFVEVPRSFSWEAEGLNFYTLSLPDPLEVPDLARSGEPNPCDLSALPPDGLTNADDIICRLWGDGRDADRQGVFSLSRFDPATCRLVARTAFRSPIDGSIRFIGPVFDHEPAVGHLVRVAAIPGQPPPRNEVVLRSRCSLRLPPRVIPDGCPLMLLAAPYDSLPRDADEMLCGVRGVDWQPDPAPFGPPDRCEAGLHDPLTGAWTSVQRFDPVAGHFLGRTVVTDPFGGRHHVGSGWTLAPTEAFFLDVASGHGPRAWDPPVEPCP